MEAQSAIKALIYWDVTKLINDGHTIDLIVPYPLNLASKGLPKCP